LSRIPQKFQGQQLALTEPVKEGGIKKGADLHISQNPGERGKRKWTFPD
jgi:hypothetical protein